MADSRDPGGEAVPNFDEIKQALEFDPFTPPASEGAGEQPAEKPAESPATPPAPGQAPQPAPGAAPTAPGGGPTSEEDLRKLVADQRALIDRLQAMPTQPPAPAEPQGEAFQPVYTVDLPRELFQALGSDDENIRYKAMDSLVKGVMNTLANDTQRYVKAQIAAAVEQVTGALPGQIERVTTGEQMRQDFYRAFPALANPVLGEIVRGRLAAWAQSEAQRTGGKFTWSEDFRDRAGRALHQELGIPIGGATSPAPSPPPPPAAPQPRKPSFSSGGNSGGGPANGPDANPFADVLF
jgi:hypothetical protein